ncbi:MAG: corrinoid protein [Deltaproteobacteria bacterium]|jgi:corrinoid protein of di/trimethylamine methyltransferase
MLDEKIIEEAKQLIIQQNKDAAAKLAEKVISEGGEPIELLNQGFIPGINQVGDLFGRGELFLPELIKAADTMKTVTDIINEAIADGREKLEGQAKVVVATVKGDVHDIGKAIVVSLMRANGFTVYDLGRDVETEKIIEEAEKVGANIIGTSALLTTTMPRQKEIEEALKSAGLRDRFKTIVGGAPVTPRWAARIGADAYAEDAQDGVAKVKELLAQS